MVVNNKKTEYIATMLYKKIVYLGGNFRYDENNPISTDRPFREDKERFDRMLRHITDKDIAASFKRRTEVYQVLHLNNFEELKDKSNVIITACDNMVHLDYDDQENWWEIVERIWPKFLQLYIDEYNRLYS